MTQSAGGRVDAVVAGVGEFVDFGEHGVGGVAGRRFLSNGRCREAIHRTSTAPSQPNPSPDLENAEREHPEESPPGACAEAAAGGGGVVVIAT